MINRFPSPQHAHAVFAPAGNISYTTVPMPNLSAPPMILQIPSPQYYPHPQPSISEVIPRSQYPATPPQVIVIKKSHRRDRSGRHRSHSHFQSSEPVVIPQPVTHSDSNSSLYHTTPSAVGHQYSRILDFPRPPHHPNVGCIVPDLAQNFTPGPSTAPMPFSLCSSCTGRKKALCIGINYRGQSNELRGCVNDARNVRKWLMKYHGFKNEDVVLLTDDTTERRHLPTRQNLINAMRWLVRSAKCNDSLFFHYSGHGGQVEDKDGDEVDGFDEVIFPLDYKEAGFIVDDELHEIMVSRLPGGCRLTALTDSCHSGTILDLPHTYSCHGRLESDVTEHWRRKKVSDADVISWSACRDRETSADTFHQGVPVGAMSDAFISSLKAQPNQSYEELLHSLRTILRSKYSQTPLLGSSHPIDMNQFNCRLLEVSVLWLEIPLITVHIELYIL
ncbi:hypothetical protein Ac2012v2_002418 [Leucoagaricus gongylophorus]